MKILVLGGTAFVGRGFVEAALTRGHEVTLFNRGQRNPGLFSELEQIHGDRAVDISGLAGRKWDAVFDSSGYFPRVVGMSASLLADSVEQYLFISSVAVIKNAEPVDQTEDTALAELDGPVVEEITGESYGPLKVLCERAVQETFGDRALIVRPGLIVGPNDHTDRFSYWPIRMRRGGKALVPDLKDQPVQIIDVRDLCEWCVRLLETKATGAYFATGPASPLRAEDMFRESAAQTSAELVWVSPEFLDEQKVQPWSDLPLIISFDGSSHGMLQIDISKAIKAGLTFRPLAKTVRDIVAWNETRGSDYVLKAGLTAEREAELLTAWDARG